MQANQPPPPPPPPLLTTTQTLEYKVICSVSCFNDRGGGGGCVTFFCSMYVHRHTYLYSSTHTYKEQIHNTSKILHSHTIKPSQTHTCTHIHAYSQTCLPPLYTHTYLHASNWRWWDGYLRFKYSLPML